MESIHFTRKAISPGMTLASENLIPSGTKVTPIRNHYATFLSPLLLSVTVETRLPSGRLHRQ